MQKNHCRRNKYDWSLLYLEYIYSGCASILLNAYVHFNWDAFVLKKPKMSCLSHPPPPPPPPNLETNLRIFVETIFLHWSLCFFPSFRSFRLLPCPSRFGRLILVHQEQLLLSTSLLTHTLKSSHLAPSFLSPSPEDRS